MSLLQRRMTDFIKPLQEDIFKYADALGLVLTDQQADLLKEVQRGHKRIAAKSGNGTGKTAISCVVGSWRTIQAVDALTVVTAPTMEQCRGVWLTEFGRIMDKCKYPVLKELFKLTKSRIVVGGREKWNIRFRTATDPKRFQGIHQANLTFIVEECSGIAADIIEAIEGNLTNQNAMMIAIGNPNTRECAFFNFFNKDRSQWVCLTFSSIDSPLASREFIERIRSIYGEDSTPWKVRVLGEFPDMDPNCIISIEDLEKCLKTDRNQAIRVPRKYNSQIIPARQFGLDYARFGDDESVKVKRFGEAMLDMSYFMGLEPRNLNRSAMKDQVEMGWSNQETVFCADANGMGDGVMIDFHEAGRRVHEFKAQHKAKRSQEFANKATESWFQFAKKCHEAASGGKPVHLLNDPMMFEQLSTRQYKMSSKGLLELESKDRYKDRTSRGSPDRADAVCMAYYDGVEAETKLIREPQPQQVARFRIGGFG